MDQEYHLCSCLVLLVTIHLALYSLLFRQARDARHHGPYEPEGPFSSSWFDSGYMFMSFYGGVGLFMEFLREGGTRTLKSVRTWHADTISMAPRIWHPRVRCHSGVQDYGFLWETTSGTVPVFNRLLVRQWIQFCVSLRCFFFLSAHCLDRQWIQICVSLRCSFVFQRNAWVDSVYNYDAFALCTGPWSLHRCSLWTRFWACLSWLRSRQCLLSGGGRRCVVAATSSSC